MVELLIGILQPRLLEVIGVLSVGFEAEALGEAEGVTAIINPSLAATAFRVLVGRT